MNRWWFALGTPRLTPKTRTHLLKAADAVSCGRSIAEWKQPIRKSIGTYDAWADGMLCHLVIRGFKIAHIIDYVQILCLPMPVPGCTG